MGAAFDGELLQSIILCLLVQYVVRHAYTHRSYIYRSTCTFVFLSLQKGSSSDHSVFVYTKLLVDDGGFIRVKCNRE